MNIGEYKAQMKARAAIMTEKPNAEMLELADDIERLVKLEARAGVGALCARNAEKIVATLRAAAPVGWKLVPLRATEVQMDAGLYQSSADSTSADVYSIYADMIDAAPSPDDHPDKAKPVPASQPRRADAVRAATIEECAKIADAWISDFGGVRTKYLNAQNYAVDAVKDIADAIRALLPASQPQEKPDGAVEVST
jgi:hypothetical protein